MADLRLAGECHDWGKCECHFQRWLYGDELSAFGQPPLAKSATVRADDRAARARAGLPTGARHEVASVDALLALWQREPARSDGVHDPELVLYLVGTHHGWGRPCFPTVQWPAAPFEVDVAELLGRPDLEPLCVRPAGLHRLESRWVERVARLNERYGPWGLARLETLLRLADHRQSEAEQMAGEEGGAA